MTGAIRSIDCTNCGAGLPVLGGGRVVTQVCGYCGASLDAEDSFRVLSVHAGLTRPDSPFRLGMEGRVDGVPFTVIGTLGQSESWRGERWNWVDHMIFSPTHGYAWITVDDGHILLTRKVRDRPAGGFLTSAAVERAETRPTRTWRMLPYRYYETSTARIDFAEGEFTYRPKVGDVATSVALLPPGGASDMLTYVAGAGPDGERELEVTRYAPELAAAFGAEPPVPEGVHPLQPYRKPAGRRFYAGLFGGSLALAILGLFVLQGTNGPTRDLYRGEAANLPAGISFEIADPARPARLTLRQPLSNAWADYSVEITDPDGALLVGTARLIEFYEGRDSDGAWAEGDQDATLDFQPSVPGTYTLALAADGVDPPMAGRVPLRVTLSEARPNPIWLVGAGAFFLLAFLWTMSSSFRHRAARWSGSDWSDD